MTLSRHARSSRVLDLPVKFDVLGAERLVVWDDGGSEPAPCAMHLVAFRMARHDVYNLTPAPIIHASENGLDEVMKLCICRPIEFVIRLAFSAFTALAAVTTASASWPTYQHDVARSGATAESVPRNPVEVWTFRSPTRPVPAWDEPALWDGWSKVHDLKNRQVFDKAIHVAVSGNRLFFGSPIDDQVHCLDVETGESIWTFFTEGPVRLAPAIDDDKIYVGSDDGYVYCLQDDSGKLIWNRRLGPTNRRVAGNGRVISPWAIRTSVVVRAGTLYCGAGVIPSEGVYICSMNAATGSEIWRTQMNDMPAQGYMLASSTRLYVLTSRDKPVVFDMKTGKRLHQVSAGTGGTYALLTGDTLVYGPNKTGEVSMVRPGKQDVLASFQGKHMIIAKPYSFLQSHKEISAIDRASYVEFYAERSDVARKMRDLANQMKKARQEDIESLQAQIDDQKQQAERIAKQLSDCLKWRSKCDCHDSLILANGVLIAGGDRELIAVDATSGEHLWTRTVPGKVYGLAASDGRLFASTDEGTIHCFAEEDASSVASVTTVQSAASETPAVRLQPYSGPIASPNKVEAEILGPFAEYVSKDHVRITWDTDQPMTSMLEFGVDLAKSRRWVNEEKSTEHEFIVDKVQRNVVYRFRVGGAANDGREIRTDTYRFDGHFDYLPPSPARQAAPYVDDQRGRDYRQLARRMLEACGTRSGYALVLGAVDGRLAYELALASNLKIVVVEPDTERVQRMRSSFDLAGIYGSRISVHQGAPGSLPYGPFLANLIASEQMLETGHIPATLESVYACLRPAGGTVFLGSFADGNDGPFGKWRESQPVEWKEATTGDGEFWFHKRPKLPATGEWTHQFARADNSACSRDDQVRGELMVQWWGRPGARPMPDRGSRNPPPVSANGRLYVQGNRTLFGLDAYNGTILWSKQIPTMRRANMPRDGSNMVATDEHLLVALGGRCVAFDGQTGERLRHFDVPELSYRHQHDWGYVSRDGSRLFGSTVRRGSQYLGDQGEWYEGFGTKDIARVTSDSFFALDAYDGSTQWLYDRGIVMNSTVTIADGRVFFIESQSDTARNAESGRLLKELMEDQVLVALDATTGDIVWEKAFDFSQCRFVTYMAHANGTLLVTGSDEKRNFHTYAFDASTSELLWQHEAPDKKGHHTGQLAHPTIVGSLVYFNKHTYDLRTGKVLGVHDFNWHGCGVMSASNHSVFSRYEYHGMLDLKTKKRTEFLGIRSGCWLSLIPSGGLLLAPESSAGCSCGHALQTSIAYVPKAIVGEVFQD